MSDSPLDSPTPNAYVVGVTIAGPAAPEPEPSPSTSDGSGVGAFDPGAATVDEVRAYVEAHPEELDDVYAAEESGKARSTLLAWLEEFRE